ncbi:protein adenylyltransferase SelO [Jeotgalibacillus proteolyticus]|uniref:Protein nucleotidyltransferase YdiU n=1 Tax=Jeotgalibacillus proteolyticus TaxID=2082395 RepID=A0A2S5GFA5_9BACL|nr:YdiU family protein [Jeotgalibacillus proteolyticus]PPA71732.1 YdiU family protein [Jeotgalibacillus proteolyticus]
MANHKTEAAAGWNLENSYSQLPKAFFATIDPSPVSTPKIAVFNDSLAYELGLNSQSLTSEDGAAILAGNRMPEGSLPLAQAYAGHQFGNLTMLGDGRALLIGEQLTPSGHRVDLQLKGSGRTPYSRGGDGRAALGPMLREYIMSEAMHALGIPTTRSLAVATTGETVLRERGLPGAVLTRVASSHLRVGTFQYAAALGKTEELKALADFAIKRHFPEAENAENPYLSFLQSMIQSQVELIVKWQLTGFIHGVMNTDNMAVSGETIDYGPCAFMDEYDPATVFSSIDIQGRYAYGKQPTIGGWNLARFAEALLPLLDEDQDKAVEMAQTEITNYTALFQEHWLNGMRAKLGIMGTESEDEALIQDLLSIMHKHEADFTNTFRALTYETAADLPFMNSKDFTDWQSKWEQRRDRQQESKEASFALMKKSNPTVIPRNHKVEEALKAAVEHDDYSVMNRLLKVLSAPYEESPENIHYTAPGGPASCDYRTYCGT